MPSLGRMLLLLLMLPGLLVPAGFGLRHCCCEGTLRIADSSSRPPPCVLRTTCAACCSPSSPDHRDDEQVAGASARGCDCSLQRAPDWQPEPFVPGPSLELPALAVVAVALTVMPVAAPTRAWHEASARAPPPPGAHRNLPLRL